MRRELSDSCSGSWQAAVATCIFTAIYHWRLILEQQGLLPPTLRLKYNATNKRVSAAFDLASQPPARMDSSANQTPVRIANSPGGGASLRALAGFLCLVIFSMLLLLGGELRVVFFLVLPTAMLALARWIEHATPEHAAVLYPDRLELPRHAEQPQVVAWSEVASISWPKNPSSDHMWVWLAVQRDARRPTEHVLVSLKEMSPANLLVLIEYLHRAGAHIEQKHWEAFCQKLALPLAEALQRRSDAGIEATSATRRWLRSFERYPFLIGFLSPIPLVPIIADVLLKLISRTMYWTMAAIIATSALINIRLVWGRWASPFSEIFLGAAAVFFLLGVFAAPEHASNAEPSASRFTVLACFVPALIGGPFLMNAAVIGWIPQRFGLWACVASFVMFHAPLFQIWREQRRRDEQAEPEAARRWEVYETTGSVPPPVHGESCD